MINSFKISLWDLFSFFMTGGIILFILYQFNLLPELKLQILETEIAKGIFYIIICYTTGIVYEPISNVIFCQIDRLYLKTGLFKRINTLLKDKDEILGEQVKQLLIKKYDLPEKKVDYFQFAKSEVKRLDKPNDFMIFLSRFGFYRNLTTITLFAFLYAIIEMIMKSRFLEFGILSALIVALHLLLYKRAKEFYIYTGNDVYRHFIIGEKETTRPKKD